VPDLDPASLDLPTLAALAGAAANDHVLRELRAAGNTGVRTSHGYVIQRLIDAQPTVGDVAADLGISQQAVSKSVAELETLGLVERGMDAADNRVRRLHLTPAGAALLERTRTARRELERRVEREVGDLTSAKRALVALLGASGGLEAVRSRRARPAS
jgi:DNA-binding MarR family transcriptional regulator